VSRLQSYSSTASKKHKFSSILSQDTTSILSANDWCQLLSCAEKSHTELFNLCSRAYCVKCATLSMSKRYSDLYSVQTTVSQIRTGFMKREKNLNATGIKGRIRKIWILVAGTYIHGFISFFFAGLPFKLTNVKIGFLHFWMANAIFY
jgi:hypothetical protein